jgi:hypothetical protein
MPGSAPTITAGATQTFTIGAAGLNGYAGNVALTWVATAQTCPSTALNLPSQVQAGYAATMTWTPYTQLQPGQTTLCSFVIQASAGGDVHNLSGAVYVSSKPTFSFALPPTQGTLTATPTTRAATVIFTPTLTPISNFCGYVSFQVTGLPTGATAAAPQVYLCSASLTEQIPITVAAGTPPGTYPLTISASGVNNSTGQTVTQYINPYLLVSSTFSLSVSPSSQNISQGGSTTYTISLLPATFSSTVTLSMGAVVSGSGVSGSLSPNVISHNSPTATLTLTAAPGATLGTYPIVVTGTPTGGATGSYSALLALGVTFGSNPTSTINVGTVGVPSAGVTVSSPVPLGPLATCSGRSGITATANYTAQTISFTADSAAKAGTVRCTGLGVTADYLEFPCLPEDLIDLSVSPEGSGSWDFDVSSAALDPIISMQVSTYTPSTGTPFWPCSLGAAERATLRWSG